MSPESRWDDRWFDAIPFDPYELLGVPRDAGAEVIDQRYRDQARRHHPDAGHGADDRMARLNWAHDLLGDPRQRAAYDRIRDERRLRHGPGDTASATGRAGPRAAPAPPVRAHHDPTVTAPPPRRRLSSLGCAVIAVLAVVAACAVPAVLLAVQRAAQRPTEPLDYVLDDEAVSCETSDRRLVLGRPAYQLTASGTLTNRTDRTTGFRVEVTFRSAAPGEPDGTRPVIDVVAAVGPLGPGESGTFEAGALAGDRPPGLTCTVTDVWYDG